jgi:hypothetical protein
MVLLKRNEKPKEVMALAMIEMKQKTKRDVGIIIVALKRTLFNRNLTQLQRQMAL